MFFGNMSLLRFFEHPAGNFSLTIHDNVGA
jgi:hypothetical protein